MTSLVLHPISDPYTLCTSSHDYMPGQPHTAETRRLSSKQHVACGGRMTTRMPPTHGHDRLLMSCGIPPTPWRILHTCARKHTSHTRSHPASRSSPRPPPCGLAIRIPVHWGLFQTLRRPISLGAGTDHPRGQLQDPREVPHSQGLHTRGFALGHHCACKDQDQSNGR